jgi:outer membrane protein assembly factor BamB
VFISPTVVGDAVLIGSCAGSFYALDRTDGKVIWRYDTSADGEPAQFHGEPVLAGQTVIVASDAEPESHLYSFDLDTGSVQWKLSQPGGFATTPLLVKDRLIAVSTEGTVVAIEPSRGRLLWKTTPAGRLEPQPFIPSPASSDDHVFLADNLGALYCLKASTGKTIWVRDLSDRASTGVVTVDDDVIVGTVDGYMNWIRARSGDVIQRMKLDGQPYGTPVVSRGRLLALVKGSRWKLVSLNAKTGAIIWERDSEAEWSTYRPLLRDSLVVIGNTDHTLCAFSQTDGTPAWRHTIDGVPRGLGGSPDRILFVGTLSGAVQAYALAEE